MPGQYSSKVFSGPQFSFPPFKPWKCQRRPNTQRSEGSAKWVLKKMVNLKFLISYKRPNVFKNMLPSLTIDTLEKENAKNTNIQDPVV